MRDARIVDHRPYTTRRPAGPADAEQVKIKRCAAPRRAAGTTRGTVNISPCPHSRAMHKSDWATWRNWGLAGGNVLPRACRRERADGHRNTSIVAGMSNAAKRTERVKRPSCLGGRMGRSAGRASHAAKLVAQGLRRALHILTAQSHPYTPRHTRARHCLHPSHVQTGTTTASLMVAPRGAKQQQTPAKTTAHRLWPRCRPLPALFSVECPKFLFFDNVPRWGVMAVPGH